MDWLLGSVLCRAEDFCSFFYRIVFVVSWNFLVCFRYENSIGYISLDLRTGQHLFLVDLQKWQLHMGCPALCLEIAVNLCFVVFMESSAFRFYSSAVRFARLLCDQCSLSTTAEPVFQGWWCRCLFYGVAPWTRLKSPADQAPSSVLSSGTLLLCS